MAVSSDTIIDRRSIDGNDIVLLWLRGEILNVVLLNDEKYFFSSMNKSSISDET